MIWLTMALVGITAYYAYVTARMAKAAESTAIVGAMSFTDSKGTQFHSLTQKPLSLYVEAKTPHGIDGYLGTWE